MLVITRFHDVLFRTEEFFEVVRQRMSVSGVTKEVWMCAYQEALGDAGVFNYQRFVRALAESARIPRFSLAQRVNAAVASFDLRDYVYSDWYAFRGELKAVCPTAVFVGVVFGEVGFEKKLVERAGLKNVFDDIFYAVMEPAEVIGDILVKYPRERTVFCDTVEREHGLEEAERRHPEVLTIAVNRLQRQWGRGCPVDVCARDFHEVLVHIKQEYSIS